MVQISLQNSGGKVVFLGVPWNPPPLGINGSKKYIGHLSVKPHLTTLDERSKAGRKREPATGSEHLLVGMKIAIPVLPSIGSFISDDFRSCVNNDCFDLPALTTFSQKKVRFWRFRIFFC